jgi:molybdate transport system substrate-binding protein
MLVGCALTVLSAISTAAPNLVSRPAAPHDGSELLVFAAASLSEALEEVDRAFTQRTAVGVKASYAASSALARQIEAGAPADVFFCADVPWVDYLDERGLLRRGTRHDLLGNTLVLIAPAGSALALTIAPDFALAAALGDGRLALADPEAVPAGKYAQAALSKLGVWPAVEKHLARAENVRAALAYVARGEAPLGIVYRTDALAEKRVRIIDTFPVDSHPPIVYPVALTATARPQAAALLEFLLSEEARAIFARYGFTAPAAEHAPH